MTCRLQIGLDRLANYYWGDLILDPWKFGGFQKRRRVYIVLVHKKVAAKGNKQSSDFQEVLDKNLKLLELDLVQRKRQQLGIVANHSNHKPCIPPTLAQPRLNGLLFADSSPEVKADMQRRIGAVELQKENWENPGTAKCHAQIKYKRLVLVHTFKALVPALTEPQKVAKSSQRLHEETEGCSQQLSHCNVVLGCLFLEGEAKRC